MRRGRWERKGEAKKSPKLVKWRRTYSIGMQLLGVPDQDFQRFRIGVEHLTTKGKVRFAFFFSLPLSSSSPPSLSPHSSLIVCRSSLSLDYTYK